MFVGDQNIPDNGSFTFNYGSSFTLTCIAQSARPSVELAFTDPDIELNFESYGPSIIRNLVANKTCDENQFCTSIRSFTITFNDSSLIYVKSIVCEAKNTTIPYNINLKSKISATVQNPNRKLLYIIIW